MPYKCCRWSTWWNKHGPGRTRAQHVGGHVLKCPGLSLGRKARPGSSVISREATWSLGSPAIGWAFTMGILGHGTNGVLHQRRGRNNFSAALDRGCAWRSRVNRSQSTATLDKAKLWYIFIVYRFRGHWFGAASKGWRLKATQAGVQAPLELGTVCRDTCESLLKCAVFPPWKQVK